MLKRSLQRGEGLHKTCELLISICYIFVSVCIEFNYFFHEIYFILSKKLFQISLQYSFKSAARTKPKEGLALSESGAFHPRVSFTFSWFQWHSRFTWKNECRIATTFEWCHQTIRIWKFKTFFIEITWITITVNILNRYYSWHREWGWNYHCWYLGSNISVECV